MTPKDLSEKLSELRLASFLAGWKDKGSGSTKKFDDQSESLETEIIRVFSDINDVVSDLLKYRSANTLNFQLEKLDGYLGKLEGLLR